MLICSTSRVLDSVRVCRSRLFSKRSNLEGQTWISIVDGAQDLSVVQRIVIRSLFFVQVGPGPDGVDRAPLSCARRKARSKCDSPGCGSKAKPPADRRWHPLTSFPRRTTVPSRGRRGPCRSGRGLAGPRNSLPILSVKRGFSWRTPLCGGLKILLDWAEKGSVLGVASLAVSPCYEGFSILRAIQKLGIPAYHARLGERARSPSVVSEATAEEEFGNLENVRRSLLIQRLEGSRCRQRWVMDFQSC